MPDDLTPGPGMVHLDNGTEIVFAQPSETAGKVTDLMRVAQWAKSGGAPADVYNAACRMLDKPNEAEQLRDEVRTLQGDLEEFDAANKAWCQRTMQVEATVESVRQYAAELRTYNSPAGIAAVYADALDALLPTPAASETETP